MAYMSQENKKQLEPAIKKICKEYGLKASISVNNHSTLVLTVASGPIDFLTPYNERTLARLTEQDRQNDYSPSTHFNVNEYHIEKNHSGRELEFLTRVRAAMMVGNHNNSDLMTDYHDVGWYVDINIGRWDKPYIYTQPAETTAPATSPPGGRIEQHTHTRDGFEMFIVTMPDRVERDEYDRLLQLAKSFGGWYSRKWGTTPAGFAFKEREQAEQFLATLAPNVLLHSGDTNAVPMTVTDRRHMVAPSGAAVADRLNTIADKLQPQIDAKLADRQTNTQKRMKQAAHARLEGYRLERTQTVLRRLAALHAAGTTPPDLARIRTKKEVYDYMRAELAFVPNGYHSYRNETGQQSSALQSDPVAVALWALLADDMPTPDPIKAAIEQLQFQKIPGYFPTPAVIVDHMLELADIEPEHRVLEPSAGSGNIADRLPGCTCIENHFRLAAILKLKGHHVLNEDFLDMVPEPKYDRIIANPPFDRGLDILHIKAMLKWLVPDGRIVTIASGGPRQERELQPLASHWEQLPAGSFKESGTGVNSVLLVIDN